MNYTLLSLLIISLLFSCNPKPLPIASELDNYFSKKFKPNQPGGAVLVMKGEEVISQRDMV